MAFASNKRKRTGAERKKEKEKDPVPENSVVIRNVPYNVELNDITEKVASYLATALELEYVVINEEGKDYALLKQGGDLVATLKLNPQHSKQARKKGWHCSSVGYLTLEASSDKSPVDVECALNDYARDNEFESVDRNGKEQQDTLAFSYGVQKGKRTQESTVATEASIDEAGEKLLMLVESCKNGKLPLKDWPMEDRRGVNELGKRRKVKPAAAAEAAGVSWNAKTEVFSK